MNTPLRRVAVAVMVMVVALLANITYVQVIKADDLRADPRNSRVLLDEYSRQRGQISAGGTVLASSVATDDRYKYLRTYPTAPEAFAPVTGFYSMQYGSTGLERAEDPVLNGSDNQLFGSRLVDLFSGRDPRGGNVVTTIDPVMQQVAYDELTSKGYTGSVVAIEPSTGKILTMVSTPSYDPNLLSGHDGAQGTKAWEQLSSDPNQPMLNRAVSQTYPPGSTFKVIVTAAALSNGVATPESQFTAAPNITLPGTSTTLENYNGTTCGPGPTASLYDAFRMSCNTAFVELGVDVGASNLKDEAAAFGIGPHRGVPIPVAESTVGPIPDDAALGQTSIGQRDVALTPLNNAVIAATIANGGVRMEPYLVDQLQGPDLSVLSETTPVSVGQAVSAQVASTVTNLMVASEQNTKGGGGRPYQIASKTGTAEHGSDPRNTPPHAWYIAFAPAQNPKIAIAVIVENGGDRGEAATGGSVAAPVARAVLDAGLQGR
ncbi:peptidoglycan D,D-transpeptidase FtsI family protein [Nocardia cyriacigeorgica]|uniref:peptidoglycan D,D-transpeptidase FtsI family protein n=1 Tax=Nocardia cyriacigeorgica TaxID=135487 RepID=UPI0013D2A2CF|nr:penicillin-binding protein 2 [Nocardia cyriacigeorgica]MBF6437844.1 penicillin-binding protein 2 [Nocardia cyriacigeorgica]MBF6453406.1 penicillin-binding protein 2 [Nocardia cyriacigeorgica]MBF6479020.1 penicillin-binding protein 2 [Nocardia cyriacigeorgica]MBF6550575.1 penicillin-binding protein 2 [Nocardia cyriacigeorgica]NEW29853.1 penicillin-binding protein 2 [Nocardia cyriacigeorgica]